MKREFSPPWSSAGDAAVWAWPLVFASPAAAANRCSDQGTAALPVPDLVGEMIARTLDDGGQMYPVQDGLSRVAARLRFPVAQ